MRLECVESGHRPEQKQFIDMVDQMSSEGAPSVMRTLLYRPELFGGAFSAMTQAVLRGDSEWTVGERELFAGFVSRVNQCPF